MPRVDLDARRQYVREYARLHRAELKANRDRWRSLNPEKDHEAKQKYARSAQAKEKHRQTYENNKAAILLRQASRYRQLHPLKTCEVCGTTLAPHGKQFCKPCRKEHNRQRQRVFYKTDEQKAKQKAYRESHPEQVRFGKRLYKLRKRASPAVYTREEMLERIAAFGSFCVYCLAPLSEHNMHLDHVVPLSKGGTNDLSNIVPACADCNLLKHTKTVGQLLDIILPVNVQKGVNTAL